MNLTNNLLILSFEVSIILIGSFIINSLVNLSLKFLKKLPILKDQNRRIKLLEKLVRRFIILATVLICLVTISANGILIYQGKDLYQVQSDLIRRIPAKFWIDLGTAILKSTSLLILVKFTIPQVRGGIWRFGDRVKQLELFLEYHGRIDGIFKDFNNIVINSAWLGSFVLSISFFYVPKIINNNLSIALRIYIIIAVGLLLIKLISIAIDIFTKISLNYAIIKERQDLYERLHPLLPLFSKCLNGIIYITIAGLIGEELKLIWITNSTPKIIQIIVILLCGSFLIPIAEFIIEELLLGDRHLTEIQKKRRLTLKPLIRNFIKYFVYFTAIVSGLKIFGIDPTAILAGAGIVGIAVGFGAQNLINDIVCGFLILFENYYLVGDYIQISLPEEDTLEGTVEAIELRTTQIRHPDGQLQIVRNGNIGSIVNYSKEYVYAKVEISVPYDVDLDTIYDIIETVGNKLKRESPDILEATQVDGLEEFGKTSLLIRTITKVKPGKHLELQRCLRRMLKDTFDGQKMKIASHDDD